MNSCLSTILTGALLAVSYGSFAEGPAVSEVISKVELIAGDVDDSTATSMADGAFPAGTDVSPASAVESDYENINEYSSNTYDESVCEICVIKVAQERSPANSTKGLFATMVTVIAAIVSVGAALFIAFMNRKASSKAYIQARKDQTLDDALKELLDAIAKAVEKDETSDNKVSRVKLAAMKVKVVANITESADLDYAIKLVEEGKLFAESANKFDERFESFLREVHNNNMSQ